MSATAEGILFQFRCSRCYAALTATTDQVGQPYACPTCGTAGQAIPEATEARIAAARSAIAASVGRPAPPEKAAWEDRAEFTRDDLSASYTRLRDEFGVTASPVIRLFAKIVDGICLMAAMMVGSVLAVTFAASPVLHSNGEPDPAAVAVFFLIVSLPVLGLQIYQWAWTANEGKTIGKKLLGIRIANQRGEGPPGFFAGVFLRSWVNFVLGSVVPFYSAADVSFIFCDNRCLHDRLAGTIVLEGNLPTRAP